LIFTIIALRAGQVALVNASIIGALLGNLLLLPALAMIIGGLKNGKQYFNKEAADLNSTMMSLSVAGLILPTLFEILREAQNAQGFKLDISDKSLDEYSLAISGVLIAVYILSLIYTLNNKTFAENEENPLSIKKEIDDEEGRKWGLGIFAYNGWQHSFSYLYERLISGLSKSRNK